MTLETLKDIFRQVSLAHNEISDFNFGEQYSHNDESYPLAFLEIPYSITYDLEATSNSKAVQFAFIVAMMPEDSGDLVAQHSSISQAERIGESIFQKIREEIPVLKFESISGVSLNRISNDLAPGFRFDVTVKFNRTCLDENKFNKSFSITDFE